MRMFTIDSTIRPIRGLWNSFFFSDNAPERGYSLVSFSRLILSLGSFSSAMCANYSSLHTCSAIIFRQFVRNRSGWQWKKEKFERRLYVCGFLRATIHHEYENHISFRELTPSKLYLYLSACRLPSQFRHLHATANEQHAGAHGENATIIKYMNERTREG